MSHVVPKRVRVIAQPPSIKRGHLQRTGTVRKEGDTWMSVDLDAECYRKNGRDRRPLSVVWPRACFAEIPTGHE